MRNKSAIVVLSGGMDSTLCLFWAIDRGYTIVKTLSFYYGQKHSVELESARIISDIANKHTWFTYGHHILHQTSNVLSKLADISPSALVSNTKEDISDTHPISSNLPASFVPGRNLLFLTMAAILAYNHEISNIITGVCQTDYSGYPDCRMDTIRALNLSLNLGMDSDFNIITPLMYLTKAESLKILLNMKVQTRHACWKALSYSHTCYNGKVPPCMKCPACILRVKGFKEAGMEDPLIERHNTI